MITTGFYEKMEPWFDGKDQKLIVLDTNVTERGGGFTRYNVRRIFPF